MTTVEEKPSVDTHIAVKICHGSTVISPVLLIPIHEFSVQSIINKLGEYGFLNDNTESLYDEWFERLQEGCIVFGTPGNKTIFNKSLQIIPITEELLIDYE